ncbi:MAG: hypothetical protein ABSE73_18845 [Planctomycetota bacterium]
MATVTVKEEIDSLLTQLPPEKQRQALDFVRRLGGQKPKGVPGSTLLKFAGCIAKEDLRLMKAAIEEGCEQVNPDGW